MASVLQVQESKPDIFPFSEGRVNDINPNSIQSSNCNVKCFDPNSFPFFGDGEHAPTNWVKGIQIGCGGFSEVYVAKIEFREKISMVVKQIKIGLPPKEKKKCEDSARTEICALKKLVHERIVSFYGFCSTNFMFFIFMEHMLAGSLSDYISNHNALCLDLVKHFTRQLLEGVEYLHSQRIIHRDIKPENILLKDDKNIKIADFGISKIFEEVSKAYTSDVGTTRYMAPEMFCDGSYKYPVDICNLKMDYKVLEKLGSGSYGEVFKVRFPSQKEYAVKWDRETYNTESVEHEARLMKSFCHPHIVDCYSYHATKDKQLFLVLLFCTGGTLRQVLNSASVNKAQALIWFSQMADALKYMHSKDVCHRDLKPENILLDETRSIKIGDLGIAKLVDERINPQGIYASGMGTSVYMSPEQLDKKRYTVKTDIWSLGCVFYELLTRKFAFVESNAVKNKEPPLLPSTFDPSLRELVKNMLNKNPDSRYSAEQVLQKTEEIQGRPYTMKAARVKEEVQVDWQKLITALTVFRK